MVTFQSSVTGFKVHYSDISGDADARCVSGGCDFDPDSHLVHHLPALCYDVVPSLLPGLWKTVDFQE